VIALVAYANAWPNTLVFDDKFFVVAERFSGLGWSGLAHLFLENVWAGYGADSGLYRPLFAAIIAAEWALFGDWAAGYHLVNITLHAIASLLVFALLRALLALAPAAPAPCRVAAFLAAALFAVHPVHAEAVNSVFNGSEMWATIGVVGGLLWLLRDVETRPVRAWAGLALIYLLALMTRETAVVLPALAALVLWFLSSGDWRARLRRMLPVVLLAVPLAAYLALRVLALNAGAAGQAPPELALTGILDSALDERAGRLVGPDRWIPWAQAWFVAFRLWLWPHPLMLEHDIRAAPAWLALLSQALLAAAAVFLLRRRRPGLFLSLALFYTALLPATVFMGRYAGTVALYERFLYLPSIGLALAFALALLWLARRFSLRAALVPALAVTLLLTPLTWARNGEWSSNVRLFESDYANGRAGPALLGQIVLTHLTAGGFAQAARYCDRHRDRRGFIGKSAEACGLTYQRLGRTADAERSLLKATEHWTTASSAQKYLAELYAGAGQRDRALEHFELSVEREPLPAMQEVRKAEMLYALYRDDPGRMREALAHLERALELQPRLVQAEKLRERIGTTPGRPAQPER
jgi:tetratricopeptide (TPR) repeat protein